MRPLRLQHARNPRSSVYATVVAALVLPIVAACGAEIEGTGPQRSGERVGRTIQPVISGSPSGGAHDAVVALSRFEGTTRRSLCTSTLVAPNLVLTARHCVSTVSGGAGCGPDGTAVVGAALSGDAAPTDMAVYVAPKGVAADTANLDAASARGKAIVVDTSATTICNRDIALVVLDRDVVAPVAKLRFGPPTASDTLTVVGFGITESGTLAPQREERSGIAWLGLGPKLYPESTTYGLGTAEAMVGESVCAGDSGGPLLAASGAIVGIASRVGNGTARDPGNMASTCLGSTTHAVYTQIGAQEPIITRAFDIAGHTPWVEGQKSPYDPPAATDEATLHATRTAADAVSGGSAPGGPGEAALTSAPMQADAASDAAGGCTASPSSPKEAVTDALGATAVLLLLFRMGRRSRRKQEKGLVLARASSRARKRALRRTRGRMLMPSFSDR